MLIRRIKIKEHQYFSEVLKLIPSNVIISKPTGFGITKKALDEPRPVIIIEANRPVIKGKAFKYNGKNTRKLNVRAIYEDVTVSDIIDYLQSDVQPKKLLTTPESYSKVVEAFKELDILDTMFETYFLLFDECEKTIQDISYRKTIVKPMDDFFKFKHKAFVSATPILPSDPRFNEQRFKHIVFEPDYDTSQDCNLIITNNTLYSLEKYLHANPKEKYFIFLNSTKAIVTAMNYLGVKDESLIFCSEESRNKLKLNKYDNAKENLVRSDSFAKFNFFTSRFNSAVDIDDVVEPQIIVLTDTYLADHTKVDPFSEVEQIIGRFRKPYKGTINRHLTHITNVSPTLVSTPKEQILLDIEVFKKVFSVLKHFRDSATSAFLRSVVDEMLERSEFSKFINNDGSVNHFMIDNAIYKNGVNAYYQTSQSLIDAYNNTATFKLAVEHQSYELTDEHKEKLRVANDLKSSLELLLPILDSLQKVGLDKFDVQLQLKQIEKEHPTAYNSFNVIGFDKAKEYNFNYRKIVAEVAKIQSQSQHNHFEFLSYLQKNFLVGKQYTLRTIKDTLNRGIEKYKLTRLRAGIDLLSRYFEITDRHYIGMNEGTKKYGYLIAKNKYAVIK